MIALFILEGMSQAVARRTIYIPDSIEALVHEQARDDESFSAALVRLVEQGALIGGDEEDWPAYIGSVEGPGDLSRNAEKYLGLKPWGPDEEPGDQGSR